MSYLLHLNNMLFKNDIQVKSSFRADRVNSRIDSFSDNRQLLPPLSSLATEN
jgi:hypothetical protein